eukprot:gene5735-6025_t
MAPQRFIKIQEFVAHAGAVTCVKIGRKSSGVLVTGGDDKKVNLWTIGTQTKALSLPGHQSPVDSVTFDHNEEIVAAGASSGSIKLFDLDQAKVTRAMSGHRSNVLCLELNMFGMVSGSMDTNVKVWDLRQKEAVNTYKGHKKGVTHVQFSPDGKWIASGCQDGEIKLWDVVAGRMISDFQGHTHPVTGLEFHPDEYLLASSSQDKTVKIWDLETLAPAPLEQTGNAREANSNYVSSSVDSRRSDASQPAVRPPPSSRSADLGPPPPRSQAPEVNQPGLQRYGSNNDRRYPPHAASAPPAASDLAAGMNKVSIGVAGGDSSYRGGEPPVQQRQAHSKYSDGAVHRSGSAGSQDIPVSVVAPPLPANNRAMMHRGSSGSLGGVAPPASSSNRLELDAIVSTSGAAHDELLKSLGFRLSNLQMCRNFLKRGDVRGALSAARRCGDSSVGADLLAGMLSRRDSLFSLEAIPELVSVLEGVLVTPNEHHVRAGLEALTLANTAFGTLIRDTCSQAARVGVDLSFEQRRDKCMSARVAMQGLTSKLSHVCKHHEALSYKAQDLSGLLATL